ncbi:hypothetical protein L1987_37576 [Smallanthus sonchifolius]|uniref:Uncharacterized protein n=1 Tax=Smallanthus sonchifolius TaxID=185202 RepID=A0ACB9HI65_9ASTR|nr:hypothetical protein L1987_37576 [Smallanthus sonchifolius]
MIVVVTIVVLCGCGMAQLSSDCTDVIVNLSPCLDYATGNSSIPSSGCCTQLASVVESQPRCLCEILKDGGSSLGLDNLNQTRVLELPKACNVQTPPTSKCNGNSSLEQTAAPPASSPTSSPTTPSSDNGSSDAISTRLTIVPLLFSLLVASYVIAF